MTTNPLRPDDRFDTATTTTAVESAVSPAVWLLGATRECGVSTLERFLAFTGDSGHRWPAGDDREYTSPYVVVVARNTYKSLTAAQNLALDHRDSRAGDGAELLGLVTVAASPTIDKPIRQHRQVVAAAFARHWSIDWHRSLLSADTDRLPRWHPLDDDATAPTAPIPTDVVTLGIELTNVVHERIATLFTSRTEATS